jgi:aspartate racemase
MKTIGLIGGMSWESTAIYYRLINEDVKKRLGGSHSARIIIHSVDFAEIESLQKSGQWHEAGKYLAQIGRSLENAGAQVLGLATNTMHKVVDQITNETTVKFVHIAHPTADAIVQCGFKNVGLLGTRFTMEESFYKSEFEKRGLRVTVPEPEARLEINRIIFEELCRGTFRPDSANYYYKVISEFKAKGIQCVILGCTEIGLLVNNGSSDLPLFDTTQLHSAALVDFSLTGS